MVYTYLANCKTSDPNLLHGATRCVQYRHNFSLGNVSSLIMESLVILGLTVQYIMIASSDIQYSMLILNYPYTCTLKLTIDTAHANVPITRFRNVLMILTGYLGWDATTTTSGTTTFHYGLDRMTYHSSESVAAMHVMNNVHVYSNELYAHNKPAQKVHHGSITS